MKCARWGPCGGNGNGRVVQFLTTRSCESVGATSLRAWGEMTLVGRCAGGGEVILASPSPFLFFFLLLRPEL